MPGDAADFTNANTLLREFSRRRERFAVIATGFMVEGDPKVT